MALTHLPFGVLFALVLLGGGIIVGLMFFMYRYLGAKRSLGEAAQTPVISEPEAEVAATIPLEAEATTLPEAQKKNDGDFMRNTIVIIEENIGSESLGPTMIADKMAMSARQFYRKFKEVSEGLSPTMLIRQTRMKRAAELLAQGKLPVQDVMVHVGISSRSHFHREFLRMFGMTPMEYKKKNEDE